MPTTRPSGPSSSSIRLVCPPPPRWHRRLSPRPSERGRPQPPQASRDGAPSPSPSEIPPGELLDDLRERLVRAREIAVPLLGVPDLQPDVHAGDCDVPPQPRV